MTWAPSQFSTILLEELIIRNMFAFVVRDFKEALDYYYPDENYPDFAESTLGKARRNEFPFLVINPRSNLIEQSVDDARTTQPLRINSHLGVIADNHEAVTKLIMRYTGVYGEVLRAAGEFGVAKRNYFAGVDPARITTPRISIEHAYGPFGSNNLEFFRPSAVELTITFDQR